MYEMLNLILVLVFGIPILIMLGSVIFQIGVFIFYQFVAHNRNKKYEAQAKGGV